MTDDEKRFDEYFKHIFDDDDNEELWDEETQQNWEEKMDSIKWSGKEWGDKWNSTYSVYLPEKYADTIMMIVTGQQKE